MLNQHDIDTSTSSAAAGASSLSSDKRVTVETTDAELARIFDENGKYAAAIYNSNSKRRTFQAACSRFLTDSLGAFLDLRWRYIIFLFAVTLTGSWIVFGLLWWAVVVLHEDDVHPETDWRPCISNVRDFPAALLFSIDLQTTNGYGFGEVETTCPHAVLLFMTQLCVGALIDVVAGGLLFAKLMRPKRRPNTILFSRAAVIYDQSDAGLGKVFQFRLADLRTVARVRSASVSAFVLDIGRTAEGENLPLRRRPLKLFTSTSRSFDADFTADVMLFWPELVSHHIDADSPLAGITGPGRNSSGSTSGLFEIVVVLEGTDGATGRAFQAMTSYLPSDVKYSERFVPLSVSVVNDGSKHVGLANFHDTQSAAVECQQ